LARYRSRLRLDLLEDRLVPSPVLLDPNLGVRPVVTGLTQATSMAFLGTNDFFVLEKTTGKVDHIINGVNAATHFDFGAGLIPNLPVNNSSERGLLGIALSPNFTNDHDVFLYWTQSSTGAVSNNTAEVPLLGNRVDRFIWNAATATLTFDRNIISLRSYQEDHNNPVNPFQGNHNAGVLRFGPDGKLYVVIGDNGRRSWLQNLINGPQGPGQTDENMGAVRGGPAPDNAHFTGVLLRLNPDGSIPSDNPFTSITNTVQAPVLQGSDPSAIGSFTAFINQVSDTLSLHIFFQDLSAPAVAGQIRLGGPDGPVIFNDPDFQAGQRSGEFTNTLTAANFVAEPPQGIFTVNDAIQAILTGQAYFTIFATQTGAEISGQINPLDPEITTNLHKVFAYGIRNTFGYAFDPFTGRLWLEENGDQSFDKISVVDAGANNGWIQSSGPLFNFDGTQDQTALTEYKSIEVMLNGLQQIRWPATNIADTVTEALNRLVMLPGAHYNPPVFSARAEIPPAGLGFLASDALGAQYQGALFEGEARDNNGGPFSDPREQFNGALFVFHPTSDRTRLDFGGDPNIRPSDGVFLNNSVFDLMGDTSFLLGTNFGILTDIQTGPNGNLYVVSLSGGVNVPNGAAVFEIFRKGALTPFQSANLVSDIKDPPGGAPAVVDPLLKNPWGIAFSATGPFWVANQGSRMSTIYSGTDATNFMKNALEVSIPGPPTGAVFNDTSDFLLSNGQPARFLFAGLDGSIFGWNSGTDAESAVNILGAVYTGLDMGSTDAGNFLYAANVSQGRIDVFDANFQLVTPGPVDFTFTDPDLPSGLTPWRPFNIDNLGDTLYVTYRNSADPEHGGIVDAFDLDGHFQRRVVSGGVNAPWGLALAPAGFGNFGGALLVGSFGLGDGKINAFDPNTGQFLGYLTDADGNPLAFEGLWYLTFGNGGSGGDPNTLYFTAGLHRTGAGSFGAMDGLFGSISFPGSVGPAKAISGEVPDPLALPFDKAILGLALALPPPDVPAKVIAQAPSAAQVLPLPDVRSVEPVPGTVKDVDHGFVASGLKQAPRAVDNLGLVIFPASEVLSEGVL
jgi:uncharacterized protein (TIGR03118 family)